MKKKPDKSQQDRQEPSPFAVYDYSRIAFVSLLPGRETIASRIKRELARQDQARKAKP